MTPSPQSSAADASIFGWESVCPSLLWWTGPSLSDSPAQEVSCSASLWQLPPLRILIPKIHIWCSGTGITSPPLPSPPLLPESSEPAHSSQHQLPFTVPVTTEVVGRLPLYPKWPSSPFLPSVFSLGHSWHSGGTDLYYTRFTHTGQTSGVVTQRVPRAIPGYFDKLKMPTGGLP